MKFPIKDFFSNVQAYGFDAIALKFFHSYFTNRKQRVKVRPG